MFLVCAGSLRTSAIAGKPSAWAKKRFTLTGPNSACRIAASSASLGLARSTPWISAPTGPVVFSMRRGPSTGAGRSAADMACGLLLVPGGDHSPVLRPRVSRCRTRPPPRGNPPMQPPPRTAAAIALAVWGAAGCAPSRAPQPAGPPGGEAAAAAADWGRAERVEVVMDEYAFRPSRIALRQGQPTLLRVVNRGARPHDFTAPAFFAAAAPRPGDPAAAAVRAKGGSVDVPAGEAREIALLPLAAGRFPLDCEKPLHAMFGMEGEIVVAA